jgi:hypothetical protein
MLFAAPRVFVLMAVAGSSGGGGQDVTRVGSTQLRQRRGGLGDAMERCALQLRGCSF